MNPVSISDVISILFVFVLVIFAQHRAFQYIRKWNAEDRLPYDRLFAIFFCVGTGVLALIVTALVLRVLRHG